METRWGWPPPAAPAAAMHGGARAGAASADVRQSEARRFLAAARPAGTVGSLATEFRAMQEGLA
eukprot:10259036-Lingulodinium_polyedra.AAC.1